MKNSQPFIITCALTGAELTKDQAPNLPVTPEEIVQAALEARDAGAAIVHLHVRDEKGHPTCREDIFQEVVQKIRAQSDLIIQVSTGGAIGDTEEDRLRPLKAHADMASLSMGSINFGEEVFLNPLPFIRRLAQEMQQHKIKPEIEIFDVAMLETALHLADDAILKTPLHLDFVFGVPGAISATEKNLDFLLSKMPKDATWSVVGIGRHQFAMIELALSKGGHGRVGMEDNLYLEKGVLATSNAQLVERAVSLVKKQGREVATSAQAREILSLDF